MDYRQYLNQKKKEKVARNYQPLILKQNSKINIIEVVSESPAILKPKLKETVFAYKNAEGKTVFAKQLQLMTTIVQNSSRLS